jgi:hypothetical protein
VLGHASDVLNFGVGRLSGKFALPSRTLTSSQVQYLYPAKSPTLSRVQRVGSAGRKPMALYPPNNPQPPSRPPPIDPRDRPKPPPPDWIPDWLKPFVPPPSPPIELDPLYDPPRPFWEPAPPDNRTQGGAPFAANHPAPSQAFDQFLTPASYLPMGNWPFWIPNGLVTFPTPESESPIRNSRQSVSSGGILGLLAQASAGLHRSTRSDSHSAKRSASGGILGTLTASSLA